MYCNQYGVLQFCGARVLSLLTCSFALVLVIASVVAADPTPTFTGVTSDVRFDPNGRPPAPGGSLSVTTVPTPPLYVTSALNFAFTPVGNLLAMQSGTPAQQAVATQVINGFVTAGDRWRALFVDPITVNVDIDFGPIGNGVLGGTSSVDIAPTYAAVRTRLVADSKSLDDVSAVASLQFGASMQFVTNNTITNVAPSTSARIRDSDTVGSASGNNNFMDLSRANAKALGIAVIAGSDANITFTDFTDFASPLPVPPAIGWDFDPTNGIASNTIDFVGVATHEIGHAMGFFSGVDTVDYFGSPNGPGRLVANGGPVDLNEFAIYSPLDLYRFSANSLAQSSQPVGGLRDGAYSQSGAGPYFSLNSGATNLALFATGGYNGDGSQASHWKDNLGIGIMDPTFALGELGVISTLDRRAMDAIGWDPQTVPEPAGLVLVFAGMLGLLVCRPGGTIRRTT